MTKETTTPDSGPRTKNTRTFWIVSAVCVVAFIAAFAFIDTKALHDWAQTVNPWVVFALMAFLPVVGGPVSLLFAIGGARFGPVGGLFAAAAAIAINLLLTYWMTKSVLQRPIAALFKKTKYKIPQVPKGEYVSVTLLTALVPGLPYAAKNYLLVLAGVPFRVYFWACLPAHFFHASLAILFGGMTKDLTKGKIIFLVAYALVITLLCQRVIKRLRAKSTKDGKPGEVQADEALAAKS
ncbi:MAG: VTT domain-containing protein [Verrucomicrobiota bacterium]